MIFCAKLQHLSVWRNGNRLCCCKKIPLKMSRFLPILTRQSEQSRTHLNEWFVSGEFCSAQKYAFAVVDVGVPLGPRKRHRRTDERHLAVKPELGSCVLLQSSKPTGSDHQTKMLFENDHQLFRGQDLCTFCSCCHKSIKQFTVRRTKSRLIILPVQAVAEDISIWTARPRRIANSINCAV